MQGDGPSGPTSPRYDPEPNCFRTRLDLIPAMALYVDAPHVNDQAIASRIPGQAGFFY